MGQVTKVPHVKRTWRTTPMAKTCAWWERLDGRLAVGSCAQERTQHLDDADDYLNALSAHFGSLAGNARNDARKLAHHVAH